MRIAVTGSIATDQLMTFRGRFAEHFLPDSLDHVSLSFLVDRLDVRRGGVAANIAFGLGIFGLRPALVGAVGPDFAESRAWLEKHGVDTAGIRVSGSRATARFLCTTDNQMNQIATFYPGAMVEAREITLTPLAEHIGGFDVVLVSPNDPQAMLRHTDECRSRGFAFAADPSQQLASMSTTEVRALVRGATWLFTNEYENALLKKVTGWSRREVLQQVRSWVTTLAEKGVRIERGGAPTVDVAAVPEQGKVDPTGVGDAFRAGFFAGLSGDLSVRRAAQVGCLLAVTALESVGPQQYGVEPDLLLKRCEYTYGRDAARENAKVIGAARCTNTADDSYVLGYN